MIWLDKKWLLKAMSLRNNIDFNNFTKYELVQILNYLRLTFLFDEVLDDEEI